MTSASVPPDWMLSDITSPEPKSATYIAPPPGAAAIPIGCTTTPLAMNEPLAVSVPLEAIVYCEIERADAVSDVQKAARRIDRDPLRRTARYRR